MSGGFECVCGFQNHIEDWCNNNEPGTDITSDKSLLDAFEKVFVKKGSLIVFSRELPHNIYPNKSDKFRYAQYLRMSPITCLQLTEEEKRNRK